MQNLRIDPQRLWDQLMETAQFGATPKGGIKRLTLTDDDERRRDWFRAQCEALGCTVTVDEVGNMFARRPGRNDALPPIAMGSHLDTQPTGGKFDGVLGRAGRARGAADAGRGSATRPTRGSSWSTGPTKRAPASRRRCCASGVFAGVFTPDYAASREDRDGKRFGDELARIGYRGAETAGRPQLGALFELHIEQGPILEAEGKVIGVVQGVQGMRWYEVTATGQDAHTGATPMHLRKNALLGAARMIERIHQIALAHAPAAVGTVGMVEVRPNSRNVVPGTCSSRSTSATRGSRARRHGARVPRRVARGHHAAGAGFEEQRIWHSPAVEFNPELIACVRQGAEQAGQTMRDMVSGAGHDAAYRACRAHDDDLRPLPRRHQPQ